MKTGTWENSFAGVLFFTEKHTLKLQVCNPTYRHLSEIKTDVI